MHQMEKTILKEVRNLDPNSYPNNLGPAEAIFIREGVDTKKEYIVYGCRCFESYQQWGQPMSILTDNIPDIEYWRKNRLYLFGDSYHIIPNAPCRSYK